MANLPPKAFNPVAAPYESEAEEGYFSAAEEEAIAKAHTMKLLAYGQDELCDMVFKAHSGRFETPEETEVFLEVNEDFFQFSQLATIYASRYVGTFDFMIDMRFAFQRWASLTDRQAKGTLNCMIADARHREPKTVVTPVVSDKATCENSVNAVIRNGIFTVVLEDGSHVTLRIKDGWGDVKDKQVAQFLSGADNENSYTGFAFITGRSYKVWNRFKDNSRITKALETLLGGDEAEAGLRYAMESGCCCRCGRTLTVPASINMGMGPDCASK